MLSLVMHCAFMDAGCLKTKALYHIQKYYRQSWTEQFGRQRNNGLFILAAFTDGQQEETDN